MMIIIICVWENFTLFSFWLVSLSPFMPPQTITNKFSSFFHIPWRQNGGRDKVCLGIYCNHTHMRSKQEEPTWRRCFSAGRGTILKRSLASSKHLVIYFFHNDRYSTKLVAEKNWRFFGICGPIRAFSHLISDLPFMKRLNLFVENEMEEECSRSIEKIKSPFFKQRRSISSAIQMHFPLKQDYIFRSEMHSQWRSKWRMRIWKKILKCSTIGRAQHCRVEAIKNSREYVLLRYQAFAFYRSYQSICIISANVFRSFIHLNSFFGLMTAATDCV